MAVMLFPCPACDERVEGAVACSGKFDYVRDGELTTWSYDLCVCPTCGMGRLNPIPTAEALRELYTSTYDAYLEPTENILTTPRRTAKMWVARFAAYSSSQLNRRRIGVASVLTRTAEA